MINHNKVPRGAQVRAKRSLLIGLVVAFNWVGMLHGQAVSVPTVFGAMGGIYGAADAFLNGRDIPKGAWDGAMFSSRLPGFVLGGVSGLGAGVVVHAATFQPINERVLVGWMSAGAMVGGVVALSSTADDIGRHWFNDTSGPRVARFLYSLSASLAVPGIRQEVLNTSSADAVLHYKVSQEIRNRFDPGEALMMGFSKETMDYFFGAGTPEFRDIKNNWEGVFRGTGRY